MLWLCYHLAPANLSKTFDGMLKDWFRGRKGYGRVLIREYVLEGDGTGREPDRNEPLASFLRRGMRLNMSMLFHDKVPKCPRCGKTVEDAINKTRKW